MSAFKNLLKSDTPTGNSEKPTGLGGQGSHFRKGDETSFSKTAEQATVIRNEPQVSGSPDISAAPASAAQASNTAGPEAGEQEHADTTSRSGGQALSGRTSEQPLQSFPQPVSNHPSTMSTSGTNQGGSGDSLPLPRFEEGSGTAAIGQTTTYSSRPLASGDPTGSIVDHESADPMTYKLPEAASHSSTTPAAKGTNETGVTSSALAAASTAWASHNQGQRMPGEFPTAGHENPYKTSSLDPRVDGGKPRQSGEATNLSSQGDTRKDLTGTSGAAGVGAGAVGASQAFNGSSAPRHDTTETAPSSLRTTADPETRSAEYGQSTTTREPDSATAPTTTSTTSAQPGAPSTASTHPQTGDENQGMMSKMLGAVGLGGAGAAAASALGYGGKTGGQDELRDTSAAASQPGQMSQETGPPKHYRRESIPTTAYPAGPTSPRAVAPPVGGAQVPATHRHSQDTHVGRDAALGAGVGGGALAASRHDDSQGLRQNITGEPGSTTHPTSGLGQGNATSSVPPSEDSHGPGFRENTTQPPRGSNTQPQTRSTVHDLITTGSPQDDSHSGRNTGLAATAVAAGAGAGAGAYGLHEHNKDRETSSTAQPSTFTDSTGYHDRSRDTTVPSTVTGSTAFPDRTRETPIDTVAAAPGRYHGQDARTYPSSTTNAPVYEQERARGENHTGRNAALGAGAGAVAGGAAYAAYNDSKDEEAARHAAAEREKASAKQREAQEKDAAKERKEHEKELERQHKHDQKEREKEEKQHQKELEKQHKHDQKEREKEEKQHQKELEKQHKHEEQQHTKDDKERAAAAAAAEKREKARLASEEEDRMRREREAQAGIAAGSVGTTGAVAGTGMLGHEKDRTTGTVGPTGEATGVGQRAHHDNIHDRDQHTAAHEQARSSHDGRHHEKHTHEEKEKKPSFFKRIFKRRKNKDTGVDEEYYSDEEDPSHGQHGTAAAAAGSAVPTHHSDAKGRNVLGSSPGNTGLTSTGNRDPTTGLEYDQAKDPQAAARLSHEPGTATGTTAGTGTGHNTYTIGRGTDDAPLGAGSASGISGQSATHQHESSNHGTVGVPHDASRDTTGAAGLGSTTGTHGASGTGYSHPSSGTERLGEIGEHHR